MKKFFVLIAVLFLFFVTSVNCIAEFAITSGGPQDDRSYCIELTSDGGFVTAGHTKSFGQGGFDVRVTKYNIGGSQEWEYSYGGSAHDEGRFIMQTSDGGYFVVGITESFGNGLQDVWALKLLADGSVD